ncbi:YgaP family membrane protein [Flavobacterium sp. MAHUQ-51]|uniref:YgaP family membrane protein n=1 Tax=Flavobacterium sp. GCM10022190 TaxID=3252639 RepID=UPI00361D9E9F
MKKNMGKTDKTIRLTVAVILASLYFTQTVTGNFGIFLIAFAVILVITSFINFCPLYTPWGINTNKKNKVV